MFAKRRLQSFALTAAVTGSLLGLSQVHAVTLSANQAEDAVSGKGNNSFNFTNLSAPGENEVGSQRSANGNVDPVNYRAARTFAEFTLTSAMIADAQAALGGGKRLELNFDVDAIVNGRGKLEGLDVQYLGIAAGDRTANTLWNSAAIETAHNALYATSSTGTHTATFSNSKVIADIAAASAGQVVAFGLTTTQGVDLTSTVGGPSERQVYILDDATSSYTLELGPKLQLVTPTAIAQTAGNTLGGFSTQNLINNTGFAAAPTVSNFATLTYTEAGGATQWVTATAAGFPSSNYFDQGQIPPQFTLDLGGSFALTDLVVWGYSTGNSNEASDFLVEFSTDGGASYYANRLVQTTFHLGNGNAVLTFGDDFTADFVRLTMLDNTKGRGISTLPGGDRVGLGEIKFLALAIPEPASFGLLLTGAMSLMMRRRRAM